ncbi:CipC1 protein, concanamycin induced protein C [Ophiocordyceps camponoti-floridani]|uniref:CipC1 protein, concanamycin induced protein C n=1 Tax=Ophiocordyceps camponoti-floridani TaxID=2030778 RepID=A0A8H4QDB5_9HYPO|nr:CipC1 protein, concanamycin induced protein C [Ophiocordyceps camponoti-floridani]
MSWPPEPPWIYCSSGGSARLYGLICELIGPVEAGINVTTWSRLQWVTSSCLAMGWFDDDSEQARAYQEVTQRPHEASWTHELLGGAAAYEAAKAYENHVERNGQPDEHAKAKEILAGAIGAFVDREVETRGLDYIDAEEAKRHAQRQAEEQLGSEGQW